MQDRKSRSRYELMAGVLGLGIILFTGCSKLSDTDASDRATDHDHITSNKFDDADEKLKEILARLIEKDDDAIDSEDRMAKLSEPEKQRLLSTARILRSATPSTKDPGPANLITTADGEELWQARGETGKRGGRLRVATFGSDPKTFNVWAASEVTSHGIGLLMFEPLVELNPWTGRFEPKLAREFAISENHLEYTFILRKGLKWSDGRALTADDVVFTFNELIKRGFGNTSARDTLSVKGRFPEVWKVDDFTIKFQTIEPFAPLLNGIRNVSIAPRHVLEKVTEKPIDRFHEFWDVNCDPESLVVSGPFKLKRLVPGQRVELERNEHYAMVDKQGQRLPYLDKFTLLIVPDQTTQILKFYGGEIDFLDIRSVRGFDAAQMKQKEEQGNYTMFNLGPDDGTTFLMLNMNRRKNPKTGKLYVDPIKQAWFNDRRFRKALSLGIDRSRMVSNILRGVGLPIFADQSPASLWFNSDLRPYGQNLEKAAALLKEAGFRFNAEDQRLYDKDGNKVEFVLQTNAGNSARDGTCVMIVNDLKKLGIKVNYQPIAWNILIDKVNTSLEWDAMVMGLTGNKIEAYDGANVWKTDGRLHMFDQRLASADGKVAVNDARSWEKEIDECFDSAATTFDTSRRRKYFNRYQEIAFEELPFIYLYATLDITAMRNTVHNYRPTPLGIYYTPKGTLHNIEEIFINP